MLLWEFWRFSMGYCSKESAKRPGFAGGFAGKKAVLPFEADSFLKMILLIRFAPVDHGFCGFAAAGTDVVQMFLLKGHAAGGNAGFLFESFLAGGIAAPHGFDKTVFAAGNRTISSRLWATKVRFSPVFQLLFDTDCRAVSPTAAG